MSTNKQQDHECPKCNTSYGTAYSMQRHMRKVHNCDIDQAESALSQPEKTTIGQHDAELQTTAPSPSPLDLAADKLYSDIHKSLVRAIDSAGKMPLSEHLLYSSYETYNDIMLNQRHALDGMMGKLSQCSKSEAHEQVLDYSKIDNLQDKYDTLRDHREPIIDRITTNFDDAEGLTSRDKQLVQATLGAANQNKMLDQTRMNSESNKNLSTSPSSSSSSSLTRSNETTHSLGETSHNAPPIHNHQQQFRGHKRPQAKVTVNNQVNSVVQSFYTQPRSQYGGYLGKSNQRYTVLENKNIARPQNNFRDKIDNTKGPFKPIIKFKPNSTDMLELNLKEDEQGNTYFTHPYENEIHNFQVDESLLTATDPIIPPDLNSTPINWVDTVPLLEEMCQHIEAEKEFAVDVEHHSYRSFQGITCLLQISTRTLDFVIDAIKLRSELHRLNSSFTNPRIVKVFHGADCDILWLQRDFGVYVVNLFDTSRAAKLMKFAHLSLAFLMKHYCNVESDKSYQLADWRERPLPLMMLQYARTDTHYLLYIYDRLRNDLLAKAGSSKNLLKNVYERGKEICLKRYEKPPFTDTSHLSVLRKSRSTFNKKQMYAFKELYAWRDSISRELDESVGYVLPNNLMIRIAEYLPREPQGITALCNPIPPTVKKYLSDIHAIILEAIDVPLDDTTKVMTGNNINADPSLRSIDLDSTGHKQDVAHSVGVQESVPTDALIDKMYHLNTGSRNGGTRSNRHHSNGKHYRKNVSQNQSKLCNFLDSSYGKPRNNRRDDMSLEGNSMHDSFQRFPPAPYQRYAASNKNN